MPAYAGRAASSSSCTGKRQSAESEQLLANFDVEDSRKRDDGTTSADLLREKIRIVRTRVQRVKSFSSTGSPLKEQRKQQQQQQGRLSSSTGRSTSRSAPELGYQSADTTARTSSTRSTGTSSARPLQSGDRDTDESGSLLGGRSRGDSSSGGSSSRSAASFFNSYGSVQSTRASCTAAAAAAAKTAITSTVFRTDEESAEALAAPLLLRTDEEEDEEVGNGGGCGGGTEKDKSKAAATSMSETPPSSGEGGDAGGNNITDNNNTNTTTTTTMTSSSTSMTFHALTARAAACVAKIPTAADELCNASHPVCIVPSLILTNGKYAAMGVPAVWLVLSAIWVPLWLLSFVVTELGVYVLLLGSIYKAGRALIRLIAFPGSSHRVYGEIEAEFGRYSCRMLDAACGVVIEAASVIISVGGGVPTEDRGSLGGGTAPGLMSKIERMMAPCGQYGYYDVAPLWGRAVSYRDRVLGVYSDVVLRCLADGGHSVDGGAASAAAAAAAAVPVPPAASISSTSGQHATTIYGNNPLVGDVGDLSDVSPDAVEDGVNFSELLQRVLEDMTRLEEIAGPVIKRNNSRGNDQGGITIEARRAAVALLRSTTELRELLPTLKPPSPSGANGDDNQDEENPHHDDDENMDALRRRLQQEKNASPVEAIKSGAASILPMLDPPPHSSVFGLDVLRGCMLSRYRGARQIWVPRSGGGGRIDVLHVPTPRISDDNSDNAGSSGRKRRAVMYCNPNAGLMEVASGMSLIGGNVGPADGTGSEQEGCWVDFYTQRGYDVYLYNYAGFGRSSGRRGGSTPAASRTPGSLGRVLRIFRGSFWEFAPSPKSMKTDALTVARYIVDEAGVDHFVIHGESIGGMAAASAARGLGTVTGVCVGRGLTGPLDVPSASQPSLLICDRSFCNLEAVAERLVGGWSGKAIRMLTPFWNTDVAGDFMAARCPKIVAQDAADNIIADASSLKSGLSVAKEMRRGATWGVARMETAPVEYRMADWENVGVIESKFFRGYHVQPPVWPADKHIALREAFHFAACARRVGKVATALRKELSLEARRRGSSGLESSDDEEGIEITELTLKRENGGGALGENSTKATRSDESRVLDAWKALACCDGMCGAPLGSTIKEGYDATVTWVCNTVTYGVQVIADAAERRTLQAGKGGEDIAVLPPDYCRMPFLGAESGPAVYPVPIPEVVSTLKSISEEGTNLLGIETEITYCIAVLEYILARASAPNVLADSLKVRHLSIDSEALLSTGCFLNLNCGHNNQYSAAEKECLWSLMEKVPAR